MPCSALSLFPPDADEFARRLSWLSCSGLACVLVFKAFLHPHFSASDKSEGIILWRAGETVLWKSTALGEQRYDLKARSPRGRTMSASWCGPSNSAALPFNVALWSLRLRSVRKRDVHILWKIAMLGQCNRRNDVIRVAALQAIIHPAPAGGRAYDLDGLTGSDPIARNRASEVQALFIELLKHEHPSYE